MIHVNSVYSQLYLSVSAVDFIFFWVDVLGNVKS